MKNLRLTILAALLALPSFVRAEPTDSDDPPSTQPTILFLPLDQPPRADAFEPCCNPCVMPARGAWLQADYLLWWIRKGPIATPLVTTGADDGSGITPGALGLPNTRILFGEDGIDYRAFSGLRIVGGFWLDDAETLGVEFSWFGLERRSVGFGIASDGDGNPLHSRPFTNAATGNPTALVSALPDELAGSIDIAAPSRLFGWEVNLVRRDNPCSSCQWLVGFRALDLNENLRIAEAFQPLTTQTIFQGQDFGPPSFLLATDSFHTTNHFYGPQIGARMNRALGCWNLEMYSKVALGWTDQRARIGGNTTLFPEVGDPITAPGGVLAQTTNSGDHSRTRFGVVPEAGVNLRLNVTQRLKVQLGYTFIYWSSVLRPGAQIDPVLSDSVIPTSPFFGAPGRTDRPAYQFRDSAFWAQGLHFGIHMEF